MMDLNTEFEQLKGELFSLGFDQTKFDELLVLATENVIDKAMEDLESGENDQLIEELSNMINTPVNNETDATERLNLFFNKVYGDQAETMKLEMLNHYLKETIEITKKAKDLATRYETGDPTAIAAVQSSMGDPDVQKVQDLL